MTDIQPHTVKTYLNEDQRWIAPGGITALRDADTITLDRSAFDFVTAFPNGFIPSGVVLARLTGGKYAPYAASPSESQTLTRTSTGGTVTLTFDGATTAAIAATAAGFTAAAVEAALEALPNLDPADVTVTGAAGGPLTVAFGGTYVGQNVPAITVDNTSATGGTITVATVGSGGGGTGSGGTETAVGFLVASVPVDPLNAATADIVAALYWHGEIDESALPTQSGLDAAAKADLAAKFRFI